MSEPTKQQKRVNDILLGPLERPALEWFSKHMPAWVTPNHLTLLGILAAILIAVSYALSNKNANFLWLANFGFALNWFGDSLDGSLARWRKIERPKFGYFIDHTSDAFTSSIICIGLGLSPFVDIVYGLFVLTGYLLMMIFSYVLTISTGVFKISYGKIGPTEIRILYVLANIYFLYGQNPSFTYGTFTITLFNLIPFAVGIGLISYFLFFSLKEGRSIGRLDPPQSQH